MSFKEETYRYVFPHFTIDLSVSEGKITQMQVWSDDDGLLEHEKAIQSATRTILGLWTH